MHRIFIAIEIVWDRSTIHWRSGSDVVQTPAGQRASPRCTSHGIQGLPFSFHVHFTNQKMAADGKNVLALTRCKDLVLVLNTPKGRGVFASTDIPSGTVLETCPVLVLDERENKEHIEKTELFHYT